MPGATPSFDAVMDLDLTTIEPSLAGPRRPQDRVALGGVRAGFRSAYPAGLGEGGTGEYPRVTALTSAGSAPMGTGSVTPALRTTYFRLARSCRKMRPD